MDWNTISTYKNLTSNFILDYKDKLNWNIISYIYKFNKEELEEIKHLLVKKNNILYMSIEEIEKKIIQQLPDIEIIEIDGNKFVVGYEVFTDYSNTIYCFNSSKHIEIDWSNDLVGKEFESDIWNYKWYTDDDDDEETDKDNIGYFGFNCFNTIEVGVKFTFNGGFLPEHIVKVLMPIETVKYIKTYGRYDTFHTKKIIIVEEVFR